ncbi:unnamed protein product [Paramecium sonneborni]|uniref:Transmembrane protein n=1 Tax=Paramecium sonneborni TaxID=65129 RepID=A0A8S1RFW6_9CILI|nr:unnamed protein product [Paramecium sonneborni]
MRLIIFILTISTVTLISSTNLNISNSCNCSELFNQDCLSVQSNCDWNSQTKQCQEIECSKIELSNHCVQSSKRCYWLNKQCNDFISCETIPGKSQQECIDANIYCPASNGINCLAIEYQQKCEKIKDPETCNDYYSPDGKCMWNGINCIILQSCTQLWSNKTKSCLQRGCYFDQLSYSCLDMKCSKHQLEFECQFGVPTIGPYLNNIIPCKWDSINRVCQNGKPDEYTIDQCYSHTARTYHWSSSIFNKGQCIACYGYILSIIIIIGLSITIII